MKIFKYQIIDSYGIVSLKLSALQIKQKANFTRKHSRVHHHHAKASVASSAAENTSKAPGNPTKKMCTRQSCCDSVESEVGVREGERERGREERQKGRNSHKETDRERQREKREPRHTTLHAPRQEAVEGLTALALAMPTMDIQVVTPSFHV